MCLCTLPPDAPLNTKIYGDSKVHLKMITGLTALWVVVFVEMIIFLIGEDFV